MPFSARSAQTIGVLAVTQLIGWGTTFESIGVLGRKLAPDLGLANEVVYAGLSVMMMVSALASPLVGKLLDRHGAARVMAVGSLFFAAGLCLLASSADVVTYAASWVILGLGGAFVLSAPAFTAVVEREGAAGKRTIAILMLFTGLSATIFWPLLSLMSDLAGWRSTLLMAAALHAFVCMPLYMFCLPKPVALEKSGESADLAPVPLTENDRKNAFLLMAITASIASFVTFGMSPSLLEVLHQFGATPEFALQLAAARGVLGISARGFDMLLGKRGNPFLTSVTGCSLMVAAFACLVLLPASTTTLWLFIALYGFGSGILVVARALLPLALFSPREYGRQATRLAMPQNIANALAPVIFTALIDRTGITSAVIIAIALSGVALTAIIMLISLVRRVRAKVALTPSRL
ncbi:MFS transporter [Rhizobiales bacterium RZME27]|uniref:MFS transporter n=1 Tax=Endobacterium cereale TaxID=2663029 RepID=A0A6A8AC41_9HYPH|nr:MFS transporter [Endobacterium cereale]MEB2847137.1 MFS transporter [Endobacterium cereale]MQY47448.1 MFS transporter [Endobacterium cereale]